ncbi:Hydroxymethylglutaryl-CoA lyase [hydrothermal vent metagenome]|uniref:Hydroxymethylglutaryl-CoA lyase n=1 Tax=hydrothermal vent metagenome TaxID=652676 RepID=A0A3B1A9X0_9ZZZZ
MKHYYKEYAQIIEVGPRDGLQNEKVMLSTEQKIEFIKNLSDCGFSAIEFSSFVSKKLVPNLSDAEAVFKSIHPYEGCSYSGLVANNAGFERAIACGVKHIAVLTSASETFCKKNINCSIQESLSRISKLMDRARNNNMLVRVYVSCAFDCEYEGEIKNNIVVDLIKKLDEMGCNEISLADTTGKANPVQVENLLEAILKLINAGKIIMHFHNNYNMALTNVLSSFQMGIFRFDSSVAGIGGCNFLPNSGGNLATEDLLYMLHAMGVHTGIDRDKVVLAGNKILRLLEHEKISSD